MSIHVRTRFWAALVTATLVLLTGSLGLAHAQTVIRLGHTNEAVSPTHVVALKWAELVNERTQGKVKINIYPQGQLGGEKSLVEQLQLGTVDATVVASDVLVGFAPDFMALGLPFAFENYDQAYRFLTGPAGSALLKKLEPIGIKGMGYINTGFRSIGNNARPIHQPEDLKGLKIREIPSPLALATVSAMGAMAVPVPWDEVISALQQRTIDGVGTGNTYYWSARLYDYTKFFSYTNHMYTANVVLMSLQSFKKLPPEMQAAVAQAATDALPFAWKTVADTEAGLTGNLEKKGIKVNTVDAKVFKDRVQGVWKEFEPKIDKELIGELRRASGK